MNILKKAINNVGEKIGNSKIVKNPVFLVIGLIVLVAIIILIYFIFLKYSPIMNFKYGGYAVSGKEITENLLGSSGDEENGANKNIELTKIEEQGTIFKKLNSFFVGDKNKTEINLEYPIYINENSAIYNLSEETTLISKDFEEISGYPNLSISEGKVYDGNNLERADGKEYIFVKTSEGIYINLQEIKLKTVVNEYTIPVNSIIAFSENGIRYYSVKNNVLVFNEIKDVDNNTNVQIVENNYTYKDLLTKLGILKEELQNNENNNEQTNEGQENTANTDQSKNNEEDNSDKNNENTNEIDNNANNTENTNNTADNNQNAYVKPEVSCEEFAVEVYTATSTLHINDPAGRIIEAPTFEIYKDGKIYLRRVYTNSGTIQIVGLLPDTEYEIKGKYVYLNEKGQKIENQFYEGKFRTKGYDALGSIDIQKENGEIYSNKIQIQKVKITLDLNAEVLKGVNQVEIVTGDIRTVLKNKQINELLQGKEITIESSEGLPSDTKIDYEIKFYDRNGVELKVNNNKGETRTSKQEPEVRVSIKEQNIVSVTLNLRLTNKDNVKLENYKYIVTKPNGEKVREEKLAENEKELILEDLDQNQYYTIKIYADFDLNDNRGKQENVEIGSLVFATQPISTLGSLDLNVENKELTGNSSTIDYTINEDRTDKRLIQILNELTIKIVEQPSNTNDSSNNENNINTNAVDEGNSEDEVTENDTSINKTNKEPIVVYTNTLTGDEITNLQQGNTKEIRYENLKSNTKYTIEITGKVKLGKTEESIPITYTYKEFITLKIPAKVEIKNQFVTGNLIDFDVRIEDVDKSVLNEKVRMELRDEKDNLIDIQEIDTNKEYIRKTYEKLEENHTYKLSFYADQYNEGSTDETYKINYLIKEIEIVTEPGISGQVGLTELTRKATGKNLVDMSSETKWYVYPNFNTYDYYGKEYDQQTKVLTLGGHVNWRRAVYDLREYAGQEVTMSFKAKNVNGSQNTYIQNSKTDTNRTKIEGLTNEWKDFQYTLTIDSTGYLGFYINGGNGIQIKELQIELGDKKTSYEEYKYTLESKYSINLEDRRDEIATNDYYLKIYEDGNLVKTDRYEEIPENNIITNAIKTYDTESGKDYKVELTIKVNNREYVLSTLEYNTKDTEEIRGIYNKEDFLEIQPRGNYIVLGDIDLSGMSDNKCMFGADNLLFEGKINFNGHKLIRDFENTYSPIFYKISDTGVIENLVLNIYFNNQIEKRSMRGLFDTNYGIIKNMQVNVLEATQKANVDLSIIGFNNYGTIENFVINFQKSVYFSYSTASIRQNFGIIKNGYIFGKNLQGKMDRPSNSWRNGSPFVVSNYQNADIRNVYSLVSVDVIGNEYENSANLLINNYGNAGVSNVYSVGIGEGYRVTSGPNISNSENTNIQNNYYFADEIFTSKFNTKTTKLALWDLNFQNQLINDEGAFNVNELVGAGYYPHLNMPDCMPNQEYIKLPEVENKDLADILSTEVLEQGSNNAKVKFIVNNPSAEQILEIKITNVKVNIVSQQYSDGKSEVIAELYDPTIYISQYNIESITTKGALNKPYTRTFKPKERVINVDLYREINSINDWKNINKSPTENYMLMTDLDFANEGSSIQISSTYTGKINGNNHTIKNIILPSGFLIYTLQGTLENLHIENLQQTLSQVDWVYGLIYTASNSIIDNVNLNGVEIKSEHNNPMAGGALVGVVQGGTKISNCFATNVNIKKTPEATINYIRIGGLIGSFTGIGVENCYVQNVNIKVNNSIEQSLGGLIGESVSGKIQNCYVTEGQIVGEKKGMGGLIGNTPGGTTTEVFNCYTNINIRSDGENIGGIIGDYISTNISNVKNNLSLGNIYTSKDTEYISRAVGNSLETGNNYAYDKQKINGYIVSEEKGARLLTYSELCSQNTYTNIIGLGNAFDYSQVAEGILPKLYDTTGKKLLPNQTDVRINSNQELEISNVTYEKTAVDKVSVLVEINNPNEEPIKEIEIENMNITMVRNTTRNGITYIEVTGTPNRYYDSYRISKILYGENQEKDVDVKINVRFYKDLYSYADWQSIEKGTYQNYRLANDIDFTGKTDINSGITMARFESSGYSLKNINLNVSGDYGSLIKEITATLNKVNFDNITITNNLSNKYIGVIANSTATIDNVNFSGITISANNCTYVACIGNSTGEIDNVNLENITINGNGYIGGLMGQQQQNTMISNITGDNIQIKAKGDYVGGIIGYIDQSISIENKNLNVKNSGVEGNNYVGGLIGRCESDLANASFKLGIVKGNSNVGGIIGGCNGSDTWTITYLTIENSEVHGNGQNIGGIYGYLKVATRYFTVKNTKIFGETVNSNGVGGVVGYMKDFSIYDSLILDSDVISKGSYVGGVAGEIGDSGDTIYNNYIKNIKIEGYSDVGGICGKVTEITQIHTNLINVKATATNDTIGGIIGYMSNKDMTAAIRRISFYYNNVADCEIFGPTNVGGLVGNTEKELYMPSSYYYGNYVEAYLDSKVQDSISLGIGGRKNQNQYLKDTYYYKYSSINGENPTAQNEVFIPQDHYLVENDLKQQSTYTSKLKWSTSAWKFNVLSNSEYPIMKSSSTSNQEGIDIPKDAEHIIGSSGINMMSLDENKEQTQEETLETTETPEQSFEYEGKEIQTYSTYSLIKSGDGSSVKRNAKLYVKNNTLYAVPTVLSMSKDSRTNSESNSNNSNNNKVIPVANNLILDSYNGKEYETVLGSDGRMYDLKEPINYPENFVNKDIESIGNNLNSDTKEIEVIYKNGDRVKFNYQTGEVIESNKNASEQKGLFEYIKEKLGEIGDSVGIENEEIRNKYEESKELQSKLEETPVEEAMEEQSREIDNNNGKNIENNNSGANAGNSDSETNIASQGNTNSNLGNTASVATTETNSANNSNTEKKYISMYNEETGNYEIYDERELLDTTKEEVVSENEKIEANNLNKYYASEGNTKNRSMGILWIVLSIIGIGIILFVLKKNLKKKN